MKKTLKSMLAGILCAVMLCGCAGNTVETSGSGSAATSDSGTSDNTSAEMITPPFWVVKDNETGGTLYLLGSMHAGKKNTAYPEYIWEAYENSNAIAVELDIIEANQDMEAQLAGLQHLLCPAGKTTKDYLGDDYDRVAEFFTAKGLPTAVLDYYVPYYWASNISTLTVIDAGLDTNCGTESIFIAKAHEDGKTVLEIESIEAQFKMMGEIPMDIQVQSLIESVGDENYQIQVAAMLQLYNAWSTFDVEQLEALCNVAGTVPEGQEEAYNEYFALMYYDRQQDMGKFAVEMLKSGGSIFMFVGAAHFYVEEDIITYLENAGYTVTAVDGADDFAAVA